ncbi:MAG TPA: sugar kinase [Treponema sp.]|nr:MAG: hypothetical protein A2001_16945 [Treponema sp. GWC1_61_84]HCM28742.1 sugar kinase [Treponema sp.]
MSAPRSGRALLCADIGTSSLKAALVDFEGRSRAFSRQGYPAERVAAGSVEAADWEAAFLAASLTLSKTARDENLDLAAVCISGNGPTLVPVQASGEALGCLHWHDGRTALPRSTEAGTGAAAAPAERPRSLFLPRAAWLLGHAPDDYARVAFFASSQEWLSWRLGAELATFIPRPAYEPFYWDPEQIARFGLDAAKFPPFALTGERIGSVSASAAERTGLAAGTPVVAGGPDFMMALVGTGAIGNGVVCDRAGTSEGINVCSDRPSRVAELRTLPHISENLWNVSAMLPTTGRLFEWFRHITGQTERSYREMLQEIETASPRSFGTRTEGERHAKGGGFFFPDLRSNEGLGASSAFISTTGLTTRPELGRAVVEAIGFIVRGGIDALERHGYRIEGMRLSGGQAKNDAWNRLKADITGRCLAVPEIEDGELAGNACAALVALGEAADLGDAVSRVVRLSRVYEPDQRAYAVHSERYDAYRAMLLKMEKFFA